MACAAMWLVRVMPESPRKLGKMRALIHRGSICGISVTAAEVLQIVEKANTAAHLCYSVEVVLAAEEAKGVTS